MLGGGPSCDGGCDGSVLGWGATETPAPPVAALPVAALGGGAAETPAPPVAALPAPRPAPSTSKSATSQGPAVGIRSPGTRGNLLDADSAEVRAAPKT